MTKVIVFHHAQGLTPGIAEFAEQLRAAGHDVIVPDLYDGATFDTLDDGMVYARGVGFEALQNAGVAVAAAEGDGAVLIGFSLGIMPAQSAAQQQPGIRGAVLVHDAIPSEEFGGPWPDAVALEVHLAPDDDWADPDAATALVAEAADGTLFTYTGSDHLIFDSSLSDFDAAQTELLFGRVTAFLDRVG